MRNLVMILVALAALGLVLAVISAIMGGSIAGITAEGFSRGCTNLAILAIALAVVTKKE